MKTAVLVLACTAALPAAFAEERPPSYSRDAMIRLFVERDEPRPLPLPRVRWHLGYFEFRAWHMDWRVLYLPIAMPLAGSRPIDVAQSVNPLAQFAPPYASSSVDLMRRPDAVDREMRRALRLEKRARVKMR